MKERNRKRNAFLEKAQLKLYQCLSSFSLTKRIIWNIRTQYAILKPVSEKSIILGTMRIVNLCIVASMVLTVFLFSIKGASVYTYIICFSLYFMITGQIVGGNLWKEEYRLLGQLEKYLGDVHHYYHIGSMVDEALYGSLEEAPYEISLHMQKIYDVLTSQEEEEIEEYKEIAPNKFLKAFLALCQITMEYGDTIKEGKSLFLINLNHLRSEVQIELLKREKIRYTFSGLIMITILPVFFLKMIEDWSISNLPELGKYYHGQYGILVSIAIFLTTVFAYVLIGALKEETKMIKAEHVILKRLIQIPFVKKKLEGFYFQYPGKVRKLTKLLQDTGNEITISEFLVQKIVLMVGTILVSLMICFNISMTERQNAIYEVSDFQGVTLVDQREQIELQREFIRECVKYYRNEEDLEQLKQQIERKLLDCKKITGESIREAVCSEIIVRIEKYQNSGFHWYYFLISGLAGILLSYGPLLILEIKRYFLRGAKEDEVMQFQTMIVMLMYIPRMNVEIILEWLENFSVLFKPSLMECVDMYSFDSERALYELKEKEDFTPFVRIVESLQACDRVGIEAAFEEIAGQRSYFLEKRKQDNEMQISEKGALGKVIAYMPMILVIGLYLIVPFVLESLTQLNGYMSQMEIF